MVFNSLEALQMGPSPRRGGLMELKQKLFESALNAREMAYAPYSNFLVGAAIKVKGNDNIYSGCNVENISYGGTICAERTAAVKAVSENQKPYFEEMALVTDAENFDSPCGICRQFLSEFSDENTVVHLCNLKGIQKTVKFQELLPFQFTSPLVKK